MRGFLRELKDRRVYRVALAYGVIASGLVQIGGTILPIFAAPPWVQQVFVVFVAGGFPFALVLAWAFDITSSGIQRTPNISGLRVSHPRQILDAGRGGDGNRRACPRRLLVLASVAQSWPNEPFGAGKKHRGPPFRKFEHGKRERIFHRRRAGSNPDRPGESGRPESDRAHQRAAVQGRPRTRSVKKSASNSEWHIFSKDPSSAPSIDFALSRT